MTISLFFGAETTTPHAAMKRPNISSGNWQAKLHRDMTPPRTKVETRDAVICDTLGNEADAIACAAVPDLLEALQLLTYGCEQAVKNGLNQPQVNGGLVLARAALTKAGYIF